MPLPLILGIGAATAGLVGTGAAISGISKMKDANDTMSIASRRHEKNCKNFEKQNTLSMEEMDKLGKLELEILHSFRTFSDVFEEIKNRPVFQNYSKNGVEIPKYEGETIKDVSVGAGVLLGGLGGTGLGVAGGFAASGAATSAVMALGTASTGTAISSLSGAALTNATLAALGGGSLAAGGGGMALGTTILGATTLGVGILVGGVIFNIVGGSISDKADRAYSEMKKAESKMEEVSKYLKKLSDTANYYSEILNKVYDIYQARLNAMVGIVNILGHRDWENFTVEEKNLVENTTLLVNLLYQMCKVEVVLRSEEKDGLNKINEKALGEAINNANMILLDRF